jgi:hypothetical protein
MPGLIRRESSKALHWELIQEVDRGDYDLTPEPQRHLSLHEERPGYRHDGLIPPLYHLVLL